jgi:hypothetical protein
MGRVRDKSLGGTTRYKLAGASPFMRSSMRKSLVDVLRAMTGSRYRARHAIAVENTPDSLFSVLLSISCAVCATSGCGPLRTCAVSSIRRSVSPGDRLGSDRNAATPESVLSLSA